MTTLQIVLLSIVGAFTIASIVFMIMFIVEISVRQEENKEEAEVKSIFSSENYVKEENKEEPKEETVDSMLAKLEEQAGVEEKPVETAEEKEEPVEEEKQEETETQNVEEEKQEETEVQNADAEETKEVEEVEESQETESQEEVAETTEEVQDKAEEVQDTQVETQENEETVVVNDMPEEPISPANLLDYKARLEKVIENRDKINKDLIKVEKSILNYERTKRRKARNQKMLDRRASELTNLNLVMYSVTDIKNVDEDKKVKQEELTSHIAELKASIQDAEEFLDSNKEKNDHDVKMAKFLIQEKARYNEEIAELEKLIAKTEGTAA